MLSNRWAISERQKDQGLPAKNGKCGNLAEMAEMAETAETADMANVAETEAVDRQIRQKACDAAITIEGK